MKKPAQLLIVCCALVVCLVGCGNSDEGVKENQANITKPAPGSNPQAMGYRKVQPFLNKQGAQAAGGANGEATTGTAK